jgi:hypothetical protein
MVRVRRRQWVCGVFLFCAVMVTASLAQTTLTTLVNFDQTNGTWPNLMNLTQGSDGNFYGTTVLAARGVSPDA